MKKAKINCFCCHIIPDVVFKELKKEGMDIDVGNQNIEKSMRITRSLFSPTPAFSMAKAGKADRFVYDSEGSRTTKRKLVLKEGQKPSKDTDVNSVYNNSGIVRAFFKEVLNWHSADNNGLDILLNVHYSSRFNNAFWDGEQMIFGDGDQTNFGGFARALDVTGHEMAHGVVQFTANLEYKGQSGALNEHFADVFGVAIKQWHLKQTAQTADWLIGDGLMLGNMKGKAIRSLKSPSDKNVVISEQPEHYTNLYKGTADNGGVHINSGIPNKAFYLVALEIGTIEATKIWFEALKTLTAKAKFVALPKALLASTKDVKAQNAIKNAFKSVGILK